MPIFGHEVAYNCHQGVNDQADGNRLFVAKLGAEPAEKQSKWRGYELNHQEGTQHGHGAEPQVCGEGSSHGNDGADAVGVNQERQQKPEKILVITDLAKRLAKALEADSDAIFPNFLFLCHGGRLFNPSEKGNGEHCPPDRNTRQAEAHH